jgi:hypothetical protein
LYRPTLLPSGSFGGIERKTGAKNSLPAWIYSLRYGIELTPAKLIPAKLKTTQKFLRSKNFFIMSFDLDSSINAQDLSRIEMTKAQFVI